MNKSSNIREFFEKFSASAQVEKKLPLNMLHSNPPVTVKTHSEHVAYDHRAVLFATDINDFGVGLPPMAHC